MKIKKYQEPASRFTILVNPEVVAQLLQQMSSVDRRSETTQNTVRRELQRAANLRRTLATRQALQEDSKKSNSLKIGQRVTFASTTNPDDVKIKRVIGLTNTPELTERKENPERRVTDDLLRAYYNNKELEKRFNEEILPTVGEAFSIPSKLVRTLSNRAYGTDNRPFMELMLGKTENYDVGDFIVDAGFPYALTKGLQLASKVLKSPITKYLTTVRFPLTRADYMRLGPIEFRLPQGRLYSGMPIPDDIRITPVEEIFEPNRWNRFRNPEYVTLQDIESIASLIPEYRNILERALDEGNYMIVPQGFPGSIQLEDGRWLFIGDEGSWIQSQSNNFKSKFKDKILKIGFKGGTDLKIKGAILTHAPETFPILDNGVFFAADLAYANIYNGGRLAPGFWLGFRTPYNMLNGEKRPFLLEDNMIRFVRSVDANPSFMGGQFPELTYNTMEKLWNSGYINDPVKMKLIIGDPSKMTSQELAQRELLFRDIRKGLDRRIYKRFVDMLNSRIESGLYRPLRSVHYDGYLGRDHALGFGIDENGIIKDERWSFGANPETYVITLPQQASLLVGNNGLFEGTAYSRKRGGKLIRKNIKF